MPVFEVVTYVLYTTPMFLLGSVMICLLNDLFTVDSGFGFGFCFCSKQWSCETQIMSCQIARDFRLTMSTSYAICGSVCYVSVCYGSVCYVSVCYVSVCYVSVCYVSVCYGSAYQISYF